MISDRALMKIDLRIWSEVTDFSSNRFNSFFAITGRKGERLKLSDTGRPSRIFDRYYGATEDSEIHQSDEISDVLLEKYKIFQEIERLSEDTSIYSEIVISKFSEKINEHEILKQINNSGINKIKIVLEDYTIFNNDGAPISSTLLESKS